MKFNKTNFFIIAVLLICVAMVILSQHVDNNNIKRMIAGNENLVNQYKLSSGIVVLEQDLNDLESSINAAVLKRDLKDISHIQSSLIKIHEHEARLKELTGINGSTYATELQLLINQIIKLDSEIISSIYRGDRSAAEKLIADNKAFNLSDKTRELLKKIDNLSKSSVAESVNIANMNAKRVWNWGNQMIILIAVILVVLFLILINRIKLINRLHESEEKLKKAAQIKENFLANMSHEIRTPLNAIMGYTQLIQRKKLDEETRFQVATIQKSGETLLSIVNDILDLSKIESGVIRIEEVDFGLQGVIQSVITMFQPKIEVKKLQLTSSVSEGVPEILNGDPVRLTQILVNLIGNAIKFTDKGEISLDVNVKQKSVNHIEIEFKVTDTGIGIAEEKLEMIFERFSQAESSTTRQYGGTGLGLAITKELVTLQKGKITAISKPGSGTMVSVTIPYKIGSVRNESLQPNNENANRYLKPDITVLIVEDNIINQGLMSRFLEEMGIEYKVANNGIEALDLLRRDYFDIIFMDIQMPEMDGYQAAKEIRQTLRLNTPIIAMTAHAMEGEREKCMHAGMNEHISKPVRESSLKNVFLNFLSKQVAEKVSGPSELDTHKENFKIINLRYLKEVSNGNLAYEKLATEQFISLMPQELESLNKASDNNNPEFLKRIAHSMRSTISIMGMDIIIQKELDDLEYGKLKAQQQFETIEKIISVCQHALREAKQYHLAL